MGVRVRFRKAAIEPEAVALKMSAIDGLTLTVGVQGKKGATRVGNTNLASVATFNEFGTRRIPQRSFLRGGIFEAKDAIAAVIADEMETYIAQPKRTAVTTLRAVGLFAASKVRTRLNTTSHWAKANALSTIASKGFDRPLHDTDLLSRSVTYAVRIPSGSIISEGAAR